MENSGPMGKALAMGTSHLVTVPPPSPMVALIVSFDNSSETTMNCLSH